MEESRMELRPWDPVIDPDPLPREAAVGGASPFAAVRDAQAVDDVALSVGPVGPLPDPRMTELRTWSFTAGSSVTEPVVVPDTWSRRDAGLCDFRGPARYERSIFSHARHARLRFDALDYVATVDVDGRRRAVHEGGFTPVAVDVPTGRPTTVAVTLDDPVEASLLRPDPLVAAKRKIKGVFEQHDSRPGGLPLGDQVEERWAERWGTGGVTGDVWLHETGPVRIDAVFVTATPGALRVSWVVTHLADGGDAELLAGLGSTGFRIHVRLCPGPNRVSLGFDVTGELLWSPEQPQLYELHTAALVDGEVSDADRTSFGFRSVEMEISGPHAYHLRLNGRRTYVRAANYIPGVWLPELDRDAIRRDLELARAAGLNSLGVHAHVNVAAAEEADRQGVLLYQDFPLQWFYDVQGGPLTDGGPDFATASVELAAEMVYLLYNHPSIVYWCGHNEPAYQLAEAWEQRGTAELASIASGARAVTDEESLDRRRAEVMARTDPTRPLLAASGLGLTRGEGDVHDYTGSFGGGSATTSGMGAAAFVSEYGAWTANFSAAEAAVGARGDWPPPERDAALDWARRTHILESQVAYAGRPERFEDFPTWCFAGQLWAGWHAKVMTEAARLERFQPSGGQRWHFLVDHWGQAGGGVVDRHRTTGPAYRGLAAANRPLLAVAPFPARGRVRPGDTVRLPVVVLNDRPHAAGRLLLRWRLAALGPSDAFLVGRDDIPPGREGGFAKPSPRDQVAVLPRAAGSPLLSGEHEVDVPADARVEVTEISWGADVGGPVALFLDLDGIIGWTSFVVEEDGWEPSPGLGGPRRFTVTSERPGTLRRRWTGEEVPMDDAPPDQYLLDDLPVDVYDDSHVTADGKVVTRGLPWSDPLG